MTFSDGDSILETPITCKVEKGFVTDISGGAEARRLLITIMAICILILIYSINKYFYIRIIQTDNKPHLKISKRQDSDK